MSFFNELKRRNVVKVGIAYAIAAWLLLQIIDVVLPNFGAPQWFVSALMFVILLGFPITLVLAWAFEFTPEGIKTQRAADAVDYQPGNKLNTMIIAGLALALVFVVLDAYVLEGSGVPEAEAVAAADNNDTFQGEITQTTADEKSIAVLPFANLSNDPDQDYFADGLTEELINKLSQIDDLLVTGRNSSFYYKGRDEELRDIGSTLGVSHILQGSVRKAGNQLRITAQLLEVAGNNNLWSQSFDREMTDIFDIQDEISEAVTIALSVTLRAGEFNRIGMTSNVDAYDAFLQGQKYALDASNGEQTHLLAVEEFERSVRIDPDFAIGWVALGSAYNAAIVFLPPNQVTGLAERRDAAFTQANDIEPDMPELRVGRVNRLWNQGELVQAEQEYLRLMEEGGAIETGVMIPYIQLLWNVGRVSDALVYAQRFRRLEPLHVFGSFSLYTMLLLNGRMDEARDEFERGIALEGADVIYLGTQFIEALIDNDKQAALQALQGMPNANNPQGGAIDIRLVNLWIEEGEEAALAELRRVLDAGNLSPIRLFVLQEWAAALGDPQLALEIMRMHGNFNPIWLPFFSETRALPEFKEIVRNLGQLDYWRETGNWGDFCRPLEGNDDFECF